MDRKAPGQKSRRSRPPTPTTRPGASVQDSAEGHLSFLPELSPAPHPNPKQLPNTRGVRFPVFLLSHTTVIS